MARSTGGAGLAPTPSGRIPRPTGGVSFAAPKPVKPAKPPGPRPTGGAGIAPPGPRPIGGVTWVAPRPPAVPPAPVAAPYVPAHSVTTTVTPPPPDMTNWQGYLTPDQLQNLYTASDQYAAGVAEYRPGGAYLQNAQANYDQATQQAQYEHDVQQNMHTQDLAARGMLQSGIAASDFADLDRSLTVRRAGAQSSLNAAVLNAQNAIDSLGRVWGHAQGVGQGQAAIDAAGMTQYQPYQQTTQVPATGTPPPSAQPQPLPAAPNRGPTNPPPGRGHVTDPFARPRPRSTPHFNSSAPRRVR